MKICFPVSILLPNAPASWPSLSIILPEMIALFRDTFEQVEIIDILESSTPSIIDKLWIVPPGIVQIPVLSWMRHNFANPLARPKALFFLGGEGAKICFHLIQYQDIFRPDDQWIVSCEAEKELIDGWFPGNNRTSVLNYPTSNLFKPLKDNDEVIKIRKTQGLHLEQEIMLYAGRISQQKNLVELLTVLEMHPHLHLLVCGDIDSVGVPHLAESSKIHIGHSLMMEIGKRHLTKRITFRPFQSQSELCKLMQASDYQISLSAHYGEDFGYSIAQGLSCGLKTVLSHWGGHRNWKNLEGVSYVELDWGNRRQIGKPILNQLYKLPSTPNKDFFSYYNQNIKQNLQSIVVNQKEGSIRPSSEIINFWEDSKKKNTEFLFSTTENPIFQRVTRSYKGKAN
jgi:glycosyltransferase involved in cell wall biosynthesis